MNVLNIGLLYVAIVFAAWSLCRIVASGCCYSDDLVRLTRKRWDQSERPRPPAHTMLCSTVALKFDLVWLGLVWLG